MAVVKLSTLFFPKPSNVLMRSKSNVYIPGMSFSNPSVFNHIKGLAKGDSLNVQTEKDANGYWQWTGIGGDNAVATENKQATPATKRRTCRPRPQKPRANPTAPPAP